MQAKQEQSFKSEEVVQPVVEAVKAPEPTPAPLAEIKPEPQPTVSKTKVLSMAPPTGKKGNPDYNAVTVYLKKDTHHGAKIALLKTSDKRDFSEFVDDLVCEWLNRQTQ